MFFAGLAAFFATASTLAQRFAAPVLVPTGNRPAALLAADFTGKGVPELLALDAAGTPSASSVRVLANAAGSFQAASVVAAAGSALLAMPARPGLLPDLYWVAVSGSAATLYRAAALSDGSYTPGSPLVTLTLSGSATPHLLLAAGGRHAGYTSSILVADTANARLYTILPNPDGTFAVQPLSGGLPLLPDATQLLTANLNGDSLPDLLVAGAGGVQVFLAEGSGPSSFTGFHSSIVYPCSGAAQSMALADMDGDAHSDLLVEGPGGRINIFHGNADGTFASVSEAGSGADDPSTGHGGHLIGAADLNADGYPDLVLANGQGITLLLGSRDRNFQLDSTYAPGTIPTRFVFTDLNGDGKPDIAFDSPGGVTVLESQALLPTVTTITDLVTPIYYGQEIGYANGIDAVVSATPADPTAPQPPGATLEGGLIFVYLDGKLVCSLVVGATNPTGGPQRCNDANFQGYGAGDHTLVGAYQGNSIYAPSTSPTYTVQILPDDTVTQLASSLTPSAFGDAVKFTATVSAPYATPTGLVQFFDGNILLGNGTLDSVGMTAFTFSSLAPGPHTITASYIPTPIPTQVPPRNFNSSQSSFAQLVQIASTTSLTSSLNPSALGVSVTFTANVALAGVTSLPLGTVTFTDGAAILQTVALSAQGTAVYTTANLAAGVHPITATFAPATPNTAGSNATLLQTVTAPVYGTDFTLTVTPSELSIGVGNTATVRVVVSEPVPLRDSVSLDCTGLPWESTCTYLKPVMASGGGVTELAVHIQAPHDCSDGRQYFVAGARGPFALALGLGTALLFAFRRRRGIRSILFATALAFLPMLGGCGFGGHCTDLGTRPGAYTFSVTAQSSGSPVIAHSQPVRVHAFLDGQPHP